MTKITTYKLMAIALLVAFGGTIGFLLGSTIEHVAPAAPAVITVLGALGFGAYGFVTTTR